MVKQTHSIPDLEGLILEKLEILKNGETKELKKKARRDVINLEKLIKDVNFKIQNGKKYPERIKPLYSPISGMSDKEKKEAYKLIDSVDTPDPEELNQITLQPNSYVTLIDKSGVKDISGVSVGKNRFQFVELD